MIALSVSKSKISIGSAIDDIVGVDMIRISNRPLVSAEN